MPPREQPFPELLATVKALRSDARGCAGVAFSRLSLCNMSHGVELIALGNSGSSQTLLGGRVTSQGCSLRRMIEPVQHTTSPAFNLQCERQRTPNVGGIGDINITNDGNIIMAAGEQVLRMRGGLVYATIKTDGCVLDAQQCPSTPSLASFVCNNSVHVVRDHDIIYRTRNEGREISCGYPSFIVQEELERFTGMWWSGTLPRLLYERTDESDIELVLVSTRQPPMRYPLTGTPNAQSDLRLIHIDGEWICDLKMRTSLSTRYPWFEYLSRAGFMNDGRTVWAVILNREQTRLAIVLIPDHEFEGFNNEGLSEVDEVTIVYEEISATWINSHNLTAPVDSPSTGGWSFIHAAETDSDCRLLLLRPHSPPIHITDGPFSVNKVGGVFVDLPRQLVYFFANYTHPTEMNFCVASFSSDAPSHACLTEKNVSCRVDRTARSASLSPDVGFVCWMSSLSHPPYCAIYQLQHGPSSLPSAIFLCHVVPPGTLSIPRAPVSDHPQLLSYQSQLSGVEHYALLHFPRGMEGPFPVVHFVYGGPGVQLVRNEWAAWVHLQKFVSLGYAALVIDGRGSDNRGRLFENQIRNQFGSVELADQIEGLDKISRMAGGLLDLSRVAIHGWSYGGFLSIFGLARHPQIYRCAVAGGTVVDWSLYDTAYTERYLGQEPAIYSSCSLESIVSLLPDEPGRLMIAHGLQDENVHFRHVEHLIEMLIKAGKPYNLQLFPSERHGIRALDGSAHFDATFFSFIAAAFRDVPREG